MSDYVLIGLMAVSMAAPVGIAYIALIAKENMPTGSGIGLTWKIILVVAMVLSYAPMFALNAYGYDRFDNGSGDQGWIFVIAAISVIASIIIMRIANE